jgi:hypothetical protein
MVRINDIPEITSEKLVKIGGVFTFEQVRDGKVIDTWTEDNIVVDEGLNYVLATAMAAGTPSTTFYVGIFKNNYVPVAANVIATFPGSGVANEATTEYNETNRPTWTTAGVSAKAISNTASPAAFTFNTPVTIYGALLATSQAKAATTGKLIAAAQFSSSRVMLATDVLNVVYALSIASV